MASRVPPAFNPEGYSNPVEREKARQMAARLAAKKARDAAKPKVEEDFKFPDSSPRTEGLTEKEKKNLNKELEKNVKENIEKAKLRKVEQYSINNPNFKNPGLIGGGSLGGPYVDGVPSMYEHIQILEVHVKALLSYINHHGVGKAGSGGNCSCNYEAKIQNLQNQINNIRANPPDAPGVRSAELKRIQDEIQNIREYMIKLKPDDNVKEELEKKIAAIWQSLKDKPDVNVRKELQREIGNIWEALKQNPELNQRFERLEEAVKPIKVVREDYRITDHEWNRVDGLGRLNMLYDRFNWIGQKFADLTAGLPLLQNLEYLNNNASSYEIQVTNFLQQESES
jgi:hypothetical protein